MSSVITIGANSYNLIQMPSSPGFAQISISMEDSVAVVKSPFVPSQFQTQAWPGADSWSAEFTPPKMNIWTAAPWRGFMAELRGMLNVFQLGDPLGTLPQGKAQAAAAPTCVTTGLQNLTSATQLYTTGWDHSIAGQLLAGDYIQIGYRLYQCCETVNSDSSGNMIIPIWPSLRESPANGSPLDFTFTQGLFRLATNTRSWHADFSRLTQMSFKCTEVR